MPEQDDNTEFVNQSEQAGKEAKTNGNGEIPEGFVIEENRPKTVIQLGSDRTKTAEKVVDILSEAKLPIFLRGGKLMRTQDNTYIDNKGNNTTICELVPISTMALCSMMDGLIRFEQWSKGDKKYVGTKSPTDIADTILKYADNWGFPAIRGILSTQSMRHDGTLITQLGYDKATGNFLKNLPPMLPIPEKPTREQALEVLLLLKGLLKEFKFVNDVDRSVALSALITPVIRPAIDVAPMHAITAPEVNSSKTYVVNISSAIATGQMAAPLTTGRTAREFETRIGAAFLSGRLIVLFDNVIIDLDSDALCVAVEQARPSIRVLGYSTNVDVDQGAVVFVTGINLTISGDLPRRTVKSSLDTKTENQYRYEYEQNPVQMILADRGKYIAAILTMCRAFKVSGETAKSLGIRPLNSFEQWLNLVAGTLVWLGEEDPTESTDVIFTESPRRQEGLMVCEAWVQALGVGYNERCTVADVARTANSRYGRWMGRDNPPPDQEEGMFRHSKLFEALMVVAHSHDGKSVDSNRLSYWLRPRINKPCGKYFIRYESTDRGWWVDIDEPKPQKPQTEMEY